jgi:hypothetical protein
MLFVLPVPQNEYTEAWRQFQDWTLVSRSAHYTLTEGLHFPIHSIFIYPFFMHKLYLLCQHILA